MVGAATFGRNTMSASGDGGAPSMDVFEELDRTGPPNTLRWLTQLVWHIVSLVLMTIDRGRRSKEVHDLTFRLFYFGSFSTGRSPSRVTPSRVYLYAWPGSAP
jgi:hypothetical protein